ncbi:GSCFA domain-containing protein [Sphingomonas sp. NSE70-1]|uniref:GSCFA domain-containing protein n=1 Tax=Sphingomonas caseinilyticus TaxID=2908205 RepID=A0ABT0RQN0_9SPHN|nr:GSCFA domain-containing protein [Sphingomonas caseinilyticus]MCL6697303.1 GSCFA domain-containing protein [Sphingomonas caseinilyticus]
MTSNPYKALPDKAFWRRTVASPAPGEVDPVGEFGLTIRPETKVATAGSCFAQHIARYLKNSGYNYYIAETGHPHLSEPALQANNYGLYSARYGNIYTARQLRQLIERAYGRFSPSESCWQEAEDKYLDPFRPTAQPGGFVSRAELEADRAQHLAAVRSMFETLDVFVFTLGLTECWRSKVDGAVFPLCPGVEGGKFDPETHEFYNQDVDDVLEDLTVVRGAICEVNPDAEIILTVSPVPLMATAEPGANVLSATTYSKSVLRVAAETMRKRHSNVHYFPSYEIISGAFNRGGYYADDLRNVVETGVSHVMGLFMKHVTAGVAASQPPAKCSDAKAELMRKAQEMVEVECDEVALDRE